MGFGGRGDGSDGIVRGSWDNERSGSLCVDGRSSDRGDRGPPLFKLSTALF